MDPISIQGLTAYQVDLLNMMWQFEELEDVEAWRDTLDTETQHQVDLLMRLVILGATDSIMVEDTAQAREYLKRFQL